MTVFSRTGYVHRAGFRLGILAVSSLSFIMVSQPGTLALDTQTAPEGLSKVAYSPRHSDNTSTTPESDVPFQIEDGEGGAFIYQVWQNLQGSEYYLFIWEAAQAETEEPDASYNFDSAAGAMNFFTCRYARERLASCNLLVSSVSYDVPETCVFPWANCE